MASMISGWAGLILGFSGLIFIHELGHFLLAKWNGVRVYVFSLGMGPYIASFTWRGTLYALSMLPIGGYVKLMGQDDLNPNESVSKDKSDYRNKRPGQKAAILAAGAVFNLIFAVIAFTLCYTLGQEIKPPRIGDVLLNTPIADAVEYGTHTPAKLEAGDRIQEVNSVPVKNGLELSMEIGGSSGDDIILCVKRQKLGDTVYVKVKPDKDSKQGLWTIGLTPYLETRSLPIGFETKDTVVFMDLKNPEKVEELKDSAALLAGIAPGDELLKVNDTEVHDTIEFSNAIQLSEGKEVAITIRRNEKEELRRVTPIKDKEGRRYKVGILLDLKRTVTKLDPDSPAARAGLKPGDIVAGFLADNRHWKSGTLEWTEPHTDVMKTAHFDVPSEGKVWFKQKWSPVEVYRAENVWDGLSVAWRDTRHFSASVFTLVKRLLSRQVGPQAMAGGVGIGTVIYTVASHDNFLNFLWLLGFISLNLGVFQFLPIPILDGWHLLMVLVEKLKGSPVAPKVQEYFSYAGLAIIACLLVFVTYNDILRLRK